MFKIPEFFLGWKVDAGPEPTYEEKIERTPLPPPLGIYHECEGWIDQFFPMIAVWHHEACRVMTNGDLREDFSILLSHE